MKFRFFTAFILAGMLASAATHAGTLTEIRFGVDMTNPPFQMKGTDGQPQGFDVEVTQAVCAAAHVRCVWVENSFDGMIPALRARKFDAIAVLGVTPARRAAIDFSDYVYHVPTRLVARSGSGLLPTAASLAGKRVGVQQGTIQEAYARAHWANAGVNVVPYADQNQIYSDLATGRLDAAFAMSVAMQRGFLSTPQGKGFDFVGSYVDDEKIFSRGTAYGIRQGDKDLKTVLDAAIAQVNRDGTFDRLQRKYFGDIDLHVK